MVRIADIWYFVCLFKIRKAIRRRLKNMYVMVLFGMSIPNFFF